MQDDASTRSRLPADCGSFSTFLQSCDMYLSIALKPSLVEDGSFIYPDPSLFIDYKQLSKVRISILVYLVNQLR